MHLKWFDGDFYVMLILTQYKKQWQQGWGVAVPWGPDTAFGDGVERAGGKWGRCPAQLLWDSILGRAEELAEDSASDMSIMT